MVKQNQIKETSPLAKRAIIFTIIAFVVMISPIIAFNNDFTWIYVLVTTALYGIALSYGIRGLHEIEMNPQLKGRGLAMTSIIVSAIIGAGFLFIFLFMFSFSGILS